MPKYAIGIAGRIGTGKTTLARALAVHMNGRILPLAGAVKGAAMSICGVGAFFPQVEGFQSREILQAIGHGLRENYAQNAWIAILRELISLCSEDVVIVPDVRYPNEVDYLKGEFDSRSLIVKLTGHPFITTKEHCHYHPSETSLDEFHDFDLVLNCENDLSRNVSVILNEAARRKWNFSRRKIRVYISGNVMGNGKFSDEFETIANLLSFADCEPLAPVSSIDYLHWSEEFGLSPNKASWNRVINDLDMVSKADAILVWLKSPSIGSAIEIFVAALLQKPVIAVVSERMIAHPFLRAFAKVIAAPDTSTVDEMFVMAAVYEIRKLLGFVNGGVGDVTSTSSIAYSDTRQ